MIIATAGHVDHGKTSLVKVLTGVDTDRLPEEKARGLTIELGFAYHDIGDGKPTGFIDVPGHEKFIRTMIAGVSGIDCVLFIVAADDGPMPQTLEHLAIMDLLNINHGVFALTKIDRVSEQRVDEVRASIGEMIANTSLKDAEIIPVSAHTRENIEQLSQQILALSSKVPGRRTGGQFRMAIDRNFVLQGTGRVIAGTVLSGEVRSEDKIRLLPQDIELRVRGIHAQNTASDKANAGERSALNISGGDLKRLEIHRGDWAVAEGARFTSTKIDTKVTVLSTEARPLRNRTPVHIHIGAADITARLITLEGQEIAPGESALVQLQLNKPVNTVYGERFVLRDQSAFRTVGGGYVVDPSPMTKGRNKPTRLTFLRAQITPDTDLALEQLLALELDNFDLAALLNARNLSEEESKALLSNTDATVISHAHGKVAFGKTKWSKLIQSIEQTTKKHHQKNPDKLGVNEGELIRSFPKRVGKRAAASIIQACVDNKTLARDGGLFRLPDHVVKRAPQNAALWDKVSKKLQASGTKAPVLHDLHTELGVDLKQLTQFLAGAAKQGFLVKVSDKRYFLPTTIKSFAEHAEALAASKNADGFTVKEYRDVVGIGRNAVIEILEYFDRVGLTFRQEQIRKLRKSAEELFS
jgi:selenocysteine-specific elongation factor